jgi:hypothetical protein
MRVDPASRDREEPVDDREEERDHDTQEDEASSGEDDGERWCGHQVPFDSASVSARERGRAFPHRLVSADGVSALSATPR